ncbi:MAG: MoxR family ATPase [Nitrospira sp.]|nr:MoxR family ATPase [Nitrospira sp.]
MNANAANPFLTLVPDTSLDLPADDHFPTAGHWWSQYEIDALIFAHAAHRPLLVRGEAGSGKSQIARAAAQVLGSGSPLVEVIHPRFEALDLLWRLDAVERLADAQLLRLDESNEKYVKHGQLWQAIERAQQSDRTPVLLIDEIDKADTDVPNALLDVLGNRSFKVPPLGHKTVCGGKRLPLIVVTTNEERELPAAFVRRCAVLNVNPPSDETRFVDWLVKRGRVHSQFIIEDSAREHAARQVLADRKVAMDSGYPRVGLAEYIDLLTALHELTQTLPDKARAKAQIHWLQRLSAYALVKNADQPQDRSPVSAAVDPANIDDGPAA